MKRINYLILLSIVTVTPVEAAVIFDQTQTGQDLLNNPSVSFPTATPVLNATSFDVTANSNIATLMQWDILSATSRGTLKFSFNIDYTALTGDNDPRFGISDGTNVQGLLRADNNGGSFYTVDGSISQILTGLGGVEPFSFDMEVPDFGTGNTTITNIVEGGFSSSNIFSLPNNLIDTDNTLSLVLVTGDTNESYRINEISLSIEDSSISTVPAPAVIWLLSSGLIGLIGIRKKSVKLSSKYA